MNFGGFHVLAYVFPNFPATLSALAPPALTLAFASTFFLRLRTHITITEGEIRYTGRLSSRVLRVSDIKGVRIHRSSYCFEPISATVKPIRIGDSSKFGAGRELVDFAAQFADLDSIDLKADEEAILSNPIYGATVGEREGRLKYVKKISGVYKFAVFPLILVLRFMNGGNIVLFCFLYCLSGLFLMYFGKGLFSFYADGKRTKHESVFIGFVVMSLMGVIKAAGNYSIFHPLVLVIPGVFFAVMLFRFISCAGLSQAEQLGNEAFHLRWISALLFSILVTCFVNCELDFFKGTNFPTRIASRHLVHGTSSGTTHYVTLGPWGNRTQGWEKQVNDTFYFHVSSGDRVIVTEKPGLLGASWFYVEKAPK